MFIFDAILESITCGDTQIPAAKLPSALQKLGCVNPQTGLTGFQQQFDVSIGLQNRTSSLNLFIVGLSRS